MKKIIKVLIWIFLCFTVLMAIVSVTSDMGFEASSQDVLYYRLGGASMLMMFAIGLFIETDIFSLRQKLKITSIKGHIILKP